MAKIDSLNRIANTLDAFYKRDKIKRNTYEQLMKQHPDPTTLAFIEMIALQEQLLIILKDLITVLKEDT